MKKTDCKSWNYQKLHVFLLFWCRWNKKPGSVLYRYVKHRIEIANKPFIVTSSCCYWTCFCDPGVNSWLISVDENSPVRNIIWRSISQRGANLRENVSPLSFIHGFISDPINNLDKGVLAPHNREISSCNICWPFFTILSFVKKEAACILIMSVSNVYSLSLLRVGITCPRQNWSSRGSVR